VSYRTGTKEEVKRLLAAFKFYYQPTPAVNNMQVVDANDFDGDSDSEQIPEFDQDINYFRNVALRDIRTPTAPVEGRQTFSYFGGADRYEDIDIFAFYLKHGPNMPVLEVIVREMLGQPAASYAPEKVFSHGKFVLNDHRTSMKPIRSEKLVLSAVRFKMKLTSKCLPRLPTDGVEDNTEETLILDEALEAAAAETLAQLADDGDLDGSDDSEVD
jgi:hypothetical protein